MRRRAFVGGLGAVLAAPRAAEAQQVGKVAHVVVLSPGEKPSRFFEVFRQTLREHGWVERENLKLELRLAGEDYARLRAMAEEVARTKPDVIVASSAPAAQAVKAATTTIPVVFHTLNDPVRTGLVASFGRPGGNLTGNAGLGPELDRKRLELLKEVVPGLTRVAVLLNPANPMTPPRVTETEETARALKVNVSIVRASNAAELDRALEAIAKGQPGGVVMFDDPIFFFHSTRIIAAMAKYQIPAVYSQWGWVQKGALMEYARFRHATAGHARRPSGRYQADGTSHRGRVSALCDRERCRPPRGERKARGHVFGHVGPHDESGAGVNYRRFDVGA